MATLPQTEPYRVQVHNAPGATTPGVNFGQQRPEIAYQAQADYQSTMSKVLDRMSSGLFGAAKEQSERAGLQFAADNPLTADQLLAMAKGDTSKVDLGNPLNVFNNAVRKARAIEVSAHAEIEGRDKLMEILKKAETGQIDTVQVRDQIAAMTNGYSSALANIDPEASYKYRATMATIGSRVIDKVAEIEGKKRLLANQTKVERDFSNVLKAVGLAVGEPPIDPATGQPMPIDLITDSLSQNFLNNTLLLVGVNGADDYAKRLPKAINEAKINAIVQHIVSDEFAKDPNAIRRLQNGDAGKLTSAYQTLLPEDRAKVMAAYMTSDANAYTYDQRRREEKKISDTNSALDFYEQWLVTKDPEQKRVLQKQILDLNVLSFDQTKNLIEGNDANPMAIFRLEDRIDSGIITNPDQLISEATRQGVSGQQLVQLRRRMSEKVSGEVKAGMKRLAGIPEGPISLDPKSDEFKAYLGIQQRFESEREKAAREGKPFDQVEVLRTLEREKEERKNSADANKARELLKMYEQRAGGPINGESLPALEVKVNKGDSKIKPRELVEIKKLIKRAEGN